jgi:hypothetical protein
VSAKITVLCLAHTYKTKRNDAEKKVRRGGFRWVDKFTIEQIPSIVVSDSIPSVLIDGGLGVGNALPFARRTTGASFHYEMPMAGDVGLRRHGLFRRTNELGMVQIHSRIIRVSRRSLFNFSELVTLRKPAGSAGLPNSTPAVEVEPTGVL